MVEEFINKQEKLEFKEIVLSHLKDILGISKNEFRGGYMKEQHLSNMVVSEYIPDQRKCYTQSIESLHDVLLPHFDKKMVMISEEYEEEVENIIPQMRADKKKEMLDDWNYRLEQKKLDGKPHTLDDQYIRSEKLAFDREMNGPIKLGDKASVRVSMKHLKLARVLFQQLNLLLKRVNYLKSSIYMESSELEKEEKDLGLDKDGK